MVTSYENIDLFIYNGGTMSTPHMCQQTNIIIQTVPTVTQVTCILGTCLADLGPNTGTFLGPSYLQTLGMKLGTTQDPKTKHIN